LIYPCITARQQHNLFSAQPASQNESCHDFTADVNENWLQIDEAETSVLFSAVRDIITRSTQMYSTMMLPLKQHAKPPNWWASLRNQNA